MKELKRIITAVFVIALTIVMSVGVSADTLIDTDEAFEVANDFITEYYYALHQYQEYDFSSYIVPDNLLEYVNGRVKSAWYANELVNTPQRLNYSLETELKSSEDLGDCLRLFVAVRASYQYPDVDFTSGCGEGVYLLIVDTDDGLKIADWHIPYEPYLEATRGNISTISYPDYWQTDLCVEGILASQTAWDAEMETRAVEINAAKTETVSEEFIVNEMDATAVLEPAATNATLYSLNKSSIVQWARNNYNASSPTSGNASLVNTYYDFSRISGNYDCTNFASHALLAGGAVLNKTSTSGSTAWYYVSLSDRTSSWSGVDKFYYFLTHNTTLGPAGNEVAYTTSSSKLFELGDIIQFKSSSSSSTWTHTTIITSIGSNETYVTGRSSASSYNNNDPVSTLSASYGGGTRVVHLTGYYN